MGETCRKSACQRSSTLVSGWPMAALAKRSLAAVILNGRPPLRPRARAEANPASRLRPYPRATARSAGCTVGKGVAWRSRAGVVSVPRSRAVAPCVVVGISPAAKGVFRVADVVAPARERSGRVAQDALLERWQVVARKGAGRSVAPRPRQIAAPGTGAPVFASAKMPLKPFC